jgi:hypothetical protein
MHTVHSSRELTFEKFCLARHKFSKVSCTHSQKSDSSWAELLRNIARHRKSTLSKVSSTVIHTVYSSRELTFEKWRHRKSTLLESHRKSTERSERLSRSVDFLCLQTFEKCWLSVPFEKCTVWSTTEPTCKALISLTLEKSQVIFLQGGEDS